MAPHHQVSAADRDEMITGCAMNYNEIPDDWPSIMVQILIGNKIVFDYHALKNSW